MSEREHVEERPEEPAVQNFFWLRKGTVLVMPSADGHRVMQLRTSCILYSAEPRDEATGTSPEGLMLRRVASQLCTSKAGMVSVRLADVGDLREEPAVWPSVEARQAGA